MATPVSGRRLRLATRGSPLARRQAGEVAARLAAANPAIDAEVVVVTTAGDRWADVPLDRIGGQGVFAAEVQRAVLDGRADVAVHSAKDLPPRAVPGLALVAIPKRLDPRDVLVGAPLGALAPGAVVATGSARRRAQLAHLRPDLSFSDLRGNMGTRLAKAGGEAAAVVTALAALKRLGRELEAAEILSETVMLPQVGQGALALECRFDDEATRGALEGVDDAGSHRAVVAERAALEALGASCAWPFGALARQEVDGSVMVEAMVASGDGRVVVRAARRGADPVSCGRSVVEALVGEAGGQAIDGLAGPAGAR